MSACLIYPFGWSDYKLKGICRSDSYRKGDCDLDWTYMLAALQSIICLISSCIVYVIASSKSLFPDEDFLQSLKIIFRIKRCESLKEIFKKQVNSDGFDVVARKEGNYGFVYNL